MTSGHALTYMATDIIGYSLLTQKDQRKAIDLLETYQSILIPLIEKENGSAIVCTGDAITTCFSSCQSAIRTGFDIQKALKEWNRSSSAEKLTTRIGIHASRPDDEGHLQQLSQTVAKSLESLGNANALCVSLPVLKGIRPEMVFHDYPLGSHDLEYLPEPLRIFYLYEEKPGFVTRQSLQLKYLKTEYIDQRLNTYSLTAITVSVLLAAALLFNTAASDIRYIEFVEIKDFSGGRYESDVHELSRQIKFKLDHVPGLKMIHPKDPQRPDTRLVCSFQLIGDNVRLTWGILDQGAEVQTSGGEVSGDIDDLEDLKKLLVQDIISQIEEG